MYLQEALQWSYFSLFIAIILGAIFGSFASFLGYRLFNEDKSLSIYGSRSVCCSCKYKLSVMDLIPVLSFLILKGKCRYCKQLIPIWHLLAEICMIFSFTLATYHFNGINQNSLLMWVVCFCLITQSIIDTRIMMSSDALHAVEFVSIFFLATNIGIDKQYIVCSYIAVVVFFCIFSWIMKKIMKKNCIGYGDIKLFIILSPIIDIEKLPLFFALCGSFGIATYFLQKFHQQKNTSMVYRLKALFSKNRQPFPFIPAIYMAFLLAFYF